MKTVESKYSNLAKNTIIFGIGTFGSKVLQFLIIPLYTYVLSTSEYGMIDLFSTTITLMLPFVTLLIHESIIRYLATNEISNKNAVSIGMTIFFISCLFSIATSILYSYLFNNNYASIFFICLVTNSYIVIFQNYLKACGKVKDFTICGLLNTFSFLVCNVLLLVSFKCGIIGYLYSMLISQIISVIFITIKGRLIKNFSFKEIDFYIVKEMLNYSIPLIPNNLMWWIMNAGDKYIINYFLGDNANGLYSLSIKLATIITTVFSIFMQAWQLSAIKENEKKEQAVFYSKVYVVMMSLLFISSIFIISVTRPLFKYIMNPEFYEANLISPLLCVATILNCIATFFGVCYLINKQTKKAFFTTVVGAVTNVLANLVLINLLGLIGVAFGTIIGYLIVVLLRIKDMKQVVLMDFDNKRSVVSMITVLALAICYLIFGDTQVLIISIISMLFIIILYRYELLQLINSILKNSILKKLKRK